MARTMVKTKRPFDNLLYWNEYINHINHEFFVPEESDKWTPQVDIKLKDGNYKLKLNIPGFSLQDIKIRYKNGYMIIEGNKKVPQETESSENKNSKDYYDNFKSVVCFPNGIQHNQIRKILNNSTLEIQVPEQKEQIGKD